MNEQKRPLFLAKPHQISQKDIRRAERFCGICIIECEDPEATRFLEPPLDADLDGQSRAALKLMRIILNHADSNFTRGQLTKWFVEELMAWNQPKPESVKKVKAK